MEPAQLLITIWYTQLMNFTVYIKCDSSLSLPVEIPMCARYLRHLCLLSVSNEASMSAPSSTECVISHGCKSYNIKLSVNHIKQYISKTKMAPIITPVSRIVAGRINIRLRVHMVHIWTIPDYNNPQEDSYIHMLLIDENVV